MAPLLAVIGMFVVLGALVQRFGPGRRATSPSLAESQRAMRANTESSAAASAAIAAAAAIAVV